MIFQNSRIIISTYISSFEIIAIAEKSSCSEQGETKDTGMYCMYTTGTYDNTGM